ncbi:MAG TPA: hypothetical protein VN452_07235 [Longilinea sp.]|nr:hypothetical protein [Longilinea sp.]
MNKDTLTLKVRQFLARIDLRTALILMVMFIFTLMLLGGNHLPASVSAQATSLTPTPNPVTLNGDEFEVTPIPAEYLATNDQTDGIVLGSVVLVLIVIVGTFAVMQRKVNGKQK